MLEIILSIILLPLAVVAALITVAFGIFFVKEAKKIFSRTKNSSKGSDKN